MRLHLEPLPQVERGEQSQVPGGIAAAPERRAQNGSALLELALTLTPEEALNECRRRGLVIVSRRELAGRPGSNHWHLRTPGRAGTLELSEWQGKVWAKVHPLREGTWAVGLATELGRLNAKDTARRAK